MFWLFFRRSESHDKVYRQIWMCALDEKCLKIATIFTAYSILRSIEIVAKKMSLRFA